MLLSLASAVLCAAAAAAATSSPLPVPPPHPRLLVNASRVAEIKLAIASISQAAYYFARMLAQGEYILPLPVVKPPPPNTTDDILGSARSVLTRTYVTGLLWQLTRIETWAHRCIAELVGVTAWPSWNMNIHALKTSE